MYVMGDNGVFGKAKNAKELTRKEMATEIINSKVLGIQMDNYVKEQKLPNLQQVANGLCDDEEIEYVEKKHKEIASLEYIDVSDVTSIYTKLKEYPYEFEIDGTLRIASVDGIKVANKEETVSKAQYEELLAKFSTMENEMNNKLNNLETQMNNLQKSSEYHVGDVADVGTLETSGQLTSSGTKVYTMFPLDKNIGSDVKSVEVSIGSASCRAEGKYIIGAGYSKPVDIPYTCGINGKNWIGIDFIKSSGYGVTNNIPVSITLENVVIKFK